MPFRHMLRQEGPEPEVETRMVPIGGSSECAAALTAGQVDATIVYIDDWIAMREQDAKAQLLGYVAELGPGLSARAIHAQADYPPRPRSW